MHAKQRKKSRITWYDMCVIMFSRHTNYMLRLGGSGLDNAFHFVVCRFLVIVLLKCVSVEKCWLRGRENSSSSEQTHSCKSQFSFLKSHIAVVLIIIIESGKFSSPATKARLSQKELFLTHQVFPWKIAMRELHQLCIVLFVCETIIIIQPKTEIF